MKYILSLGLVIFAAGCADWNAAKIPGVPKSEKPHEKHNPDSCPKELVGDYEEMSKTQDLMIKIYENTKGILMGLPIFKKTEMWDQVVIADGMRHEQDSDSYRVAYCEDGKIASFGVMKGESFKFTIVKTADGFDFVREDKAATQKFKKIK